MQLGYALIAADFVVLYDQAMRPLVYGVLAIVIIAVMGIDKRSMINRTESTLWAFILAVLYIIVLFILGLVFGFGINMLASSTTAVVSNLWNVGFVFLMGNIIMFKLLSNASNDEAVKIVTILTIAFTVASLFELRSFAQDFSVDIGEFIFISLLFNMAINMAASYFAYKGSFASVLIISGVYTLPLSFSPVLPDIQSLPWSLISTAVLGASMYIYIVASSDETKSQKLHMETMTTNINCTEWLRQKFSAFNIISAGTLALLAAFFIGVFPHYPTAVLTTSMTGTFDRGSLVMLHRVPEGHAFDMVEEGSVIHFQVRGREYIHRVIAFRYNADGQRFYITQGDANPAPDPWYVEQDDVIGVAWGALPFVGYPRVVLYFWQEGNE